MKYKSQDVFGITTDILAVSYVDRGDLDASITRHLSRNTHIALRGESACGKSWLRKRTIPDAIVVQCRLNKTPKDLYSDALGEIGLQIVTETTSEKAHKFSLEAIQEIGISIIAKLQTKQTAGLEMKGSEKKIPIGNNLDDIRFIAEAIKSSGRRLVIEDFHYLSPQERNRFAFDLKALWDYGLYVVIIGIWSDNNLLIHLNPDLAGRIHEFSITWTKEELKKVSDLGSAALNISISPQIIESAILDSFGTVGVFQKLLLSTLDESKIDETQEDLTYINNIESYLAAAMLYAEQLNALYQTFAARTARGIRQRKNSTGIYAHMLRVVMSAPDDELTAGLSIDEIFKRSHEIEARVQKPNLRQILLKIDEIQVDDNGRGLVISFDEHKDEVSVVDRRLLFYRKYATTKWPWESILKEDVEATLGFDGEA